MGWNLACPDWQERIRSELSLIPNLPLFEDRSTAAVKVFDRLKLADVPGTPTMEKAAGKWFRDIVRALHGSLDDAGRRHIQEVFVLVPKKNSKTSNGALLMLTSLLINKRPKAKFILVAPTHDITEMAFAQVEGAISLDPQLCQRFHVQNHLKKVTYLKTGAFLEVLSFDPSVLTGQKHAGALIDELHVVGGMAKAASAVGQLRGGMVSYPESFLAFITTQSEKPPAGVFKAELTKAREIRDGKREGVMLPVLYEFPDDIAKGGRSGEETWRDRKLWAMVTPNAGRSITVDRLASDYADAVSSGPDELRRWASQHLNIEIGLSLGSDRWAGAEFWQDAADPGLTLETLIARCDVVVVGIDGGGLDDLFGLCVLGRDRDTRKWLAICRAWAHVSVLERRKSEAPRLLDLQKAGDLTIKEVGQDLMEAVAIIRQVDEAGILSGVGADPYGIGAFVDALAEIGIGGEEDSSGSDRMQGVSQGWKLTGAIKTAERKLADGTLRHAGQALMAWCVGNAKVEPRGNAVIITKQSSGTAKIDPLMAMFDAIALMSTVPEAPNGGPSAYETGRAREGGFLVV